MISLRLLSWVEEFLITTTFVFHHNRKMQRSGLISMSRVLQEDLHMYTDLQHHFIVLIPEYQDRKPPPIDMITFVATVVTQMYVFFWWYF